MSSDERCRSAKRLLAQLAASPASVVLFQSEALYHAQIGWTCDLLDVVDKVADPMTAALVTDLIFERLTSNGASEAEARLRETQTQFDRRMREPWRSP